MNFLSAIKAHTLLCYSNCYSEFTECSITIIDTVAILVPYFHFKKHHAISIFSTIRLSTCEPYICHNFPVGCQPHSLLCSIGAIHPHAFPRSKSLGFDEGLDGSQFPGRGHQSKVTAYCLTVRLGSGLGHRARDESTTGEVDQAPATQTCLIRTKQTIRTCLCAGVVFTIFT